MKGCLAVIADAIGDIDHPVLALQQQATAKIDAFSMQKGSRRQMRLAAHEIIELGAADAAGLGQITDLGEGGRVAAQAGQETAKERLIPILAAIEQLRPTALARAQALGQCCILAPKKRAFSTFGLPPGPEGRQKVPVVSTPVP